MVPCQEIGEGIPYATVSELITALGRDPAASGTEPLWLAEASRVCPGLRTIYPGIPPAPDAPTDSIRLRVAEAVIRMMEAVADNGSVLLAFDDLQFLDPASREVLRSEEHTSELQSLAYLVCRLLLEKKKKHKM